MDNVNLTNTVSIHLTYFPYEQKDPLFLVRNKNYKTLVLIAR